MSFSPDIRWTPADHGLLSWTYDPAQAAAGSILGTAGQVNFARLHIPFSCSITNIWLYITSAGSGLTSGQSFAGLYSSAGNLLGATADQSTPWASTGSKSMAISGGAVAVTPGDYLIGFFSNGTTLPTFLRGVSQAANSVNLSAANSRFGTASSGNTTAMPSAIGTLAVASNAWWVGLN